MALDNLITYAEFPPLVSELLAPQSHKPKPQGGFLTVKDDPTDYKEPILRPELYPADKELLDHIASELDLDATFMDKLSYTQLMNYVHIAYMEFKPFASTLRSLSNLSCDYDDIYLRKVSFPLVGIKFRMMGG